VLPLPGAPRIPGFVISHLVNGAESSSHVFRLVSLGRAHPPSETVCNLTLSAGRPISDYCAVTSPLDNWSICSIFSFTLSPRDEDALERAAADALHVDLVPGTEIMRDVEDIHFSHLQDSNIMLVVSPVFFLDYG
jgi:hypothetical protein